MNFQNNCDNCSAISQNSFIKLTRLKKSVLNRGRIRHSWNRAKWNFEKTISQSICFLPRGSVRHSWILQDVCLMWVGRSVWACVLLQTSEHNNSQVRCWNQTCCANILQLFCRRVFRSHCTANAVNLRRQSVGCIEAITEDGFQKLRSSLFRRFRT